MLKYVKFTACALVILSLGVAHAADKAKKKAQVKCPVSGKLASKEFTAEYKGGTVLFCCPKCPGAFKAKTDKFAAKANHQLVLTGQAKQVKCPIAGRALNPKTAIQVAGAEVAFCCNGCKGRAEGMKEAKQITVLFGDKAFDKAFKVDAKKKDKK